jgi:hypothetical protein
VAIDKGDPERGLTRKVVVQRRLRKAKFRRDIRVAERVVPAQLHESLGDVKDT